MKHANLNNNHSNPTYNKRMTGKMKTNSPPPPAPTPTQAPRPRLPGSLSTNTTSSGGGSRDIFAHFKSSPLPLLATRPGYPLCLPRSSSSADRVQVVERTDASTSASNEHENPDEDDTDLFGPEPDSESDVAKSKSPSPRQAGFPLCLPSRSTVHTVERSDASTSMSASYGPAATPSATSPTLDEDGVELITKDVFEGAKDANSKAANKNSSSKKDKGHSGKKKRKTPPPKMEDINKRVGAPSLEPHEDGIHTFRLPRPPNAVVITCKPFPPPPPPPETASSSPLASNDEQGANAAGPSQPRVTPRKSAVSTPATTLSSSSPLAGPSKRPTATARARARTQRPPRPAALESHEPPAQAPDTNSFWGQRLSKPSPSRSSHALPTPGQSDNPSASTSSLPVAAPRTTLDKEGEPVDSPHVLPATDVIFFRGQPYKPSEAPNYGSISDGQSGSSPTAAATPNAGSSHGHAVTNESHKAAIPKKKAKGPAVPRGRKKIAQGPEGQGRAADDNSSVKKKPPRKKPVGAAPTSGASIASGTQGQQTSTTNTANCMESTFPAKPRGRTSSTSSEEIPLSSIYHSGVGTGAAAMGSSFTGMPSTLSARQLCGQDCISLDVSIAPQAADVPVPSTLPKRNAPAAAAHRPTPAAKRKRGNGIEDSQLGPARKAARTHEPESSPAVSVSYTQAAEPVSMGAPTASLSASSHSQTTKRKRSAEPEDDSEPGPARKRPVRFSGEISYDTAPPSLDATTSSSLDHAMDMDMEIVSASGKITFLNPWLAANAHRADIAHTVPHDSDAGYYGADYLMGALLPDLPGYDHAVHMPSAHQVSGSSFSGSPFIASDSLGDSAATPNPIFPQSSLAPAVSQTSRPAPAVAVPQSWIPPLAPTPAVDFTPPSPSPPPTQQWEFFKIADNVYWGPDRESCRELCPLPYPLGLIMGASTLNFPPGTLQNWQTLDPLLDWLAYMTDTRYIPGLNPETLDPLRDWLHYMSDTRYMPAPR